ncbi:uncharacterized protein ACHE_60563A [Aspergillus chevalieri]|uniref:LysM domain-containing protein n=1 Tax=Aspergillus chevalieri TaxID=182096 RepID=A0A7R7ZRT4_ASPCH|nr:uncharacterized protein ACHE_60563A [Aspergillus chevalieri]BCR90677.1 hypothetical protein ACHE_60563A [Aspergillus chevalieri]
MNRAVPTDAVTTSNTDYGCWYKIQTGDTSDSMCAKFGISPYDFDFLNPQAACVQPVGNINTYTSYVANSSTTFTSLGSTININATQTVNHTTTHLFWSFPSDPTTSSTWTVNDTFWSSLQL